MKKLLQRISGGYMHRIFNIRTFLFLALAIVLIVLIIAQQSLLDRNIEKNESLQMDIKKVEQHIEELNQEREILGTDDYVEKKAREKLGYVKSDETVFVKNE